MKGAKHFGSFYPFFNWIFFSATRMCAIFINVPTVYMYNETQGAAIIWCYQWLLYIKSCLVFHFLLHIYKYGHNMFLFYFAWNTYVLFIQLRLHLTQSNLPPSTCQHLQQPLHKNLLILHQSWHLFQIQNLSTQDSFTQSYNLMTNFHSDRNYHSCSNFVYLVMHTYQPQNNPDLRD